MKSLGKIFKALSLIAVLCSPIYWESRTFAESDAQQEEPKVNDETLKKYQEFVDKENAKRVHKKGRSALRVEKGRIEAKSKATGQWEVCPRCEVIAGRNVKNTEAQNLGSDKVMGGKESGGAIK